MKNKQKLNVLRKLCHVLVTEVKKRWRHLKNYRKSLKRKESNGRTMRARREENTMIDIEEDFRCSPSDISGLDIQSAGSLITPMAVAAAQQDNAVDEIFKVQDIFEVEPNVPMPTTILTGKLEIDDTALELQQPPTTPVSSSSHTLESDPTYDTCNMARPDSDEVYRLRDDPALLLSEIFRDIVNQASKEVHPIKKLFDCFADCVVALPEDLQRDCKNRMMLMISEYEETASYRRTQID